MPSQNDADLRDLIEQEARTDSGYAIAYALLRIAEAQDRTATQLKYLGTGDAASTMGAVELLAMELKGVGQALAEIGNQLGTRDC